MWPCPRCLNQTALAVKCVLGCLGSTELHDAWNFMTREALIATGSPVCGLRPVRAARSECEKAPKPGQLTLSAFFTALVTTDANASMTLSASAFETPAASATALMAIPP